jgi:hypothetical protein
MGDGRARPAAAFHHRPGRSHGVLSASRKMAIFVDRAWLSGLLFGTLVYLFMSLIVVPFSAAPFRISLQIQGLLVHMFFIGLPIALSVSRYSKTGA